MQGADYSVSFFAVEGSEVTGNILPDSFDLGKFGGAA